MKRLLALCLAALLLFGLATAASGEETAAGTTIRLQESAGTVTVKNASGKAVAAREGMRLYNGYSLSTGSDGSAAVSLDGTKAVKLGASASVELKKSGSRLELMLRSGELYFSVTEPLGADEELNIRTPTMVTGIRGSSGWVKQGEVGLLHGHIIVSCFGARRGREAVSSGHGVRDRAAGYEVFPLQTGDVPLLALRELAADETLQAQLRADVPELDVDELIASLPEREAGEAAAREQAQQELEERLAAQEAEAGSGTVNQVFEEEQEPEPEPEPEPGDKNGYVLEIASDERYTVEAAEAYEPVYDGNDQLIGYRTAEDGSIVLTVIPSELFLVRELALYAGDTAAEPVPNTEGSYTLTLEGDAALEVAGSFFYRVSSLEELTEENWEAYGSLALVGFDKRAELIEIDTGRALLFCSEDGEDLYFECGEIKNDGELIIGAGATVTVGSGSEDGFAGGISGWRGNGTLTVESGATLNVSFGMVGGQAGHTICEGGTVWIAGSFAATAPVRSDGCIKIDPDCMLTLYSEAEFVNGASAEIFNYGTILNNAAFENRGMIENGGTFENYGSVSNYGRFENVDNGAVTGDGTWTDYGG